MTWYKPADVGFATRQKLGNLGYGARLFIRLLATFVSSFKRFGLVRDQICVWPAGLLHLAAFWLH